jgi:hypothetical protein
MPAAALNPSGAYVAHNREATAGGDVFKLDITSSLLVPPGGDEGELVLEIPGLDITHRCDGVVVCVRVREQRGGWRSHLLARTLTSAQNRHVHTRRQALALPDKPGYSSGDGVTIKGSLGGMRIATITTQLSIPADSVKLWWPVGYGKQVRRREGAGCSGCAPSSLSACSCPPCSRRHTPPHQLHTPPPIQLQPTSTSTAPVRRQHGLPPQVCGCGLRRRQDRPPHAARFRG